MDPKVLSDQTEKKSEGLKEGKQEKVTEKKIDGMIPHGLNPKSPLFTKGKETPKMRERKNNRVGQHAKALNR
jgi:hypothetical protein